MVRITELVAEVGDVAHELTTLGAYRAPDVHRGDPAPGDLPLDAAPRAAQLAGDLVRLSSIVTGAAGLMLSAGPVAVGAVVAA